VRARAVRRVVIAIVLAGIAGMIVSSIANNNSAALTFGLVTAVAVLCSMVASAVTGGPVDDAEAQAARVDTLTGDLVRGGADEHVVRALVREAVRLGRVSGGAERPEG
jgi:hypothetical protein